MIPSKVLCANYTVAFISVHEVRERQIQSRSEAGDASDVASGVGAGAESDSGSGDGGSGSM